MEKLVLLSSLKNLLFEVRLEFVELISVDELHWRFQPLTSFTTFVFAADWMGRQGR